MIRVVCSMKGVAVGGEGGIADLLYVQLYGSVFGGFFCLSAYIV